MSIDLIEKPRLEHDDLLRATKRMKCEGGGFAGALAEAWFFADKANSRILEEAFDHIFRRYSDANS